MNYFELAKFMLEPVWKMQKAQAASRREEEKRDKEVEKIVDSIVGKRKK